MEIAVVNPQTVLQMYHCKEYPWHQVVSPMADKEMIIANADFTTTSAIARRRLSSKKRKKPGSCPEGGLSDGSSTSPLYSPPRNSSPAVSSTTQTPPPAQESKNVRQTLTCKVPEHRHTHTTTTIHTTHTSPPHPQFTTATGTGVPLVGATTSGSLVPLAPSPYHLPAVRPSVAEHDLQQQLANPMSTQLQQELNYRYLQGQGAMLHGTGGSAAFSVPHSQPEKPLTQPSTQAVMDTSPESSGWPHKVKWCCAHVTIAKQIQAHRLQTKTRPETVLTHPESFATLGAKPATGVPAPAVFDANQRMALMQMYGIPPATTLAGYMAMPNIPYSVQDLQIHMQPFVQPAPAVPASFVNTTNIISVKPNSSMAAQTAEGMGFPMVNNVQLVPYPVTTVLPAGMNSLVQGSYVGPVPVIGNCVINPCAPGIMASPWVR